MIELFGLLFGYITFLIISRTKAYKSIKIRNDYDNSIRNDRRDYAIAFNKPVWYEKSENGNKIYRETRTNRKVFLGKDVSGLKRWYYSDTNKPMKYAEDYRIIESLNTNSRIARTNGKKWCVVENFWDDSVIRLQNDFDITNTYLDDYRDREDPFVLFRWNKYICDWNKANPNKISKSTISYEKRQSVFDYSISNPEIQKLYKKYFYDNNPINQKVYLKNMRPYQLYVIGMPTETNYNLLKQKQYMIRFGKPELFNFKNQHCISDKQIDFFWSKWYAITEEEYLELTTTNKGLKILGYKEPLTTIQDLKYNLKPIRETNIAFITGNEKINWNKIDCGIKRAFDKDGNFAEDI